MLFTYLVWQLVFVTARASVVFEDCDKMPKPTKGGIYKKQYSEDELQASIEAVKNGMSTKCPIPARSAYDLQTVNIQGCGMRLPCFVTLGDRIPVNVRFYADFVSRQLDQDVTIKINFVHARTPVTPEHCETVMCPVRTDAETSFTSVMSVPTNMALNQRGYLQWRVYNENGQRVLCYQVMVQTQNFFQKILRHYLALLGARMERFDILLSRDTFNTTGFFNSSILLSKLITY